MLAGSLDGLCAPLATGRAKVELKEAQTVTLQADAEAGDVTFHLQDECRLVLLSGPNLEEPVVQYGPIIMNDAAQIDAAMKRYQNGEMGRLATMPF